MARSESDRSSFEGPKRAGAAKTRRAIWCAASAVVIALVAPTCNTGAQAATRLGRAAAPCVRTTIVRRTMPTGPAQYESGVLALKNGASLRLQGDREEMYQAQQLDVGDPVAACYGPQRRYADAGPARSITVLDLRNGLYYGTLIGNWPAP